MKEGQNIYQELEIEPGSELAENSLDDVSVKKVGTRRIFSVNIPDGLTREDAVAYIDQIKDEILGEVNN